MSSTAFILFSVLPLVAALGVLWVAFLPRIRQQTPTWLWWILMLVALVLLALPLLIRLSEINRTPLYATIGGVVLVFGLLQLVRGARGDRLPRRQVAEVVEAAGWVVLGGSFFIIAREPGTGSVGMLLGVLLMALGTMLAWWNDWLDGRTDKADKADRADRTERADEAAKTEG